MLKIAVKSEYKFRKRKKQFSDCYRQHVICKLMFFYTKAFHSVDQNIYQHFVTANWDSTYLVTLRYLSESDKRLYPTMFLCEGKNINKIK